MYQQRNYKPKPISTRATYYRASLLMLIAVVFTVACAPAGSLDMASTDSSPASSDYESDAAAGASYDEPSIVTEAPAAASEGAADEAAGPTIVTSGDTADHDSSADAAPASAPESHPPRPRPSERPQESSTLKAGEVDDNEDWADYLDFRRKYRGPAVHNRDISERYIIQVVDENEHPVLNANVRIFLEGQSQEIYEAYTYANGRALFHPKTLDRSLRSNTEFIAIVKKGNAVAKVKIPRYSQQGQHRESVSTVQLELIQQVRSVNLDVLFLVDATGSMGDEIHAIQSTIFEVADRIDNLPENPNVRYGLVTYRDRGDEYISKTYGFENNIRRFSNNLDRVYADGGGDYPEALNEGLHKALHNVSWRSGDTVRIIFLIADAPPHLDYHQDYDYAVEMETAARSAIKIFPIASSGLDEQGEYIFRQIAQFTQGRFVFLTYDGPTNGGKSGDVTTHNVDSYSVSNLDDLLVDLVTYELSHQNPLLSWQQ